MPRNFQSKLPLHLDPATPLGQPAAGNCIYIYIKTPPDRKLRSAQHSAGHHIYKWQRFARTRSATSVSPADPPSQRKRIARNRENHAKSATYICIFYNDGNTEPLGMLGTNRGLVRHRTRGIPIIAWAFGIFATSTIFTPKAFAMSFLTGQPISANCSFAESHLDRTGDQSRAQLNKKAGKAPSLRVALNRFSGF